MATINFRYTRDVNLKTSQRIFYEKNGYLIFPNFIPQDVLDKCRQRFDDIVEGKVSQEQMKIIRDVKDRKSIIKLQDIQYDSVFQEYLKHSKILDIVENFTGPNILLIHNMFITKPPDSGFGTSKHPPHQDVYYFPYRPIDHIVAVWTAMEPCDSVNGCLYVSPGSHTLNRLFPHNYPPGSTPGSVNKFYHGILDLPEGLMPFIDLEMKPGDTVFFHPLLIHGSGVNKSNKTRLAISGHYAAAECSCEEQNIGPAQKVIQTEILDYAKKKYPGLDLTYIDLWNYKSMLVHGIKSSL